MPPETEVEPDADTTTDTDDGAADVPSRLDAIEAGLARIGQFIAGGVGSTDADADDDGDGTADDVDDDVTDDAPVTTGRRSQAQVTDDVEALVRRQLEKIHKEEETDQRLAKVEERVAEKPPEKMRKLTSVLWGDKK